MQGMSERVFAAHAGLSRRAIQKAKTSGRLVLHADGSIELDAIGRRVVGADPVAAQPSREARMPCSSLFWTFDVASALVIRPSLLTSSPAFWS